jgi:hypothetical protein
MEQHDRADVRVELDVEVLRLDLADRRTDPTPALLTSTSMRP